MKWKEFAACALVVTALLFSLTSCKKAEKQISVIVREPGSGTREAFDRIVTDGTHYLEERNELGKKIYRISKTAIQQTKNGTVLSAVASDPNAIGYSSLGALSDVVKTVRVNGVEPTAETVRSGAYGISRPFVIMTRAGQALTPATADFLHYLKSDASELPSQAAGCIFLTDPARRANEGATPVEVTVYEKQASLPEGVKILLRGSTSLEKFIHAAAKSYAELYGVPAQEIFDIRLEGSSVGQRAVEEDVRGNVIGLSSAAVVSSKIDSFNVCLDAVAVIVNPKNTAVTDLTLAELYGIFSGEIKYFNRLASE